MGGERPARSWEAQERGLTDPVWDVTVRCWHQDLDQRPKMKEVVRLTRERPVLSLSSWDEHHNMVRVVTGWRLLGRLESRISQPRSSSTTFYPSVKSRTCFPSVLPTGLSPPSRPTKHSGDEGGPSGKLKFP